MRPQHFSWILLAGLLFGFSGEAASKDSPLQRTHKLHQDVTSAIQRKAEPFKRKKIIQFLAGYFDFQTFARWAMEDYWHSLTGKQRKEFLRVFQKRFEERVLKSFLKIKEPAALNFKILGKQEKKDHTRISAIGFYKNKKASLTLYWIPKKGSWYLVDLDFSKANLLANYKGQFNKIMREKGFDELMRRLKEHEIK